MTNHLHNLQLEAGVKASPFLFRRGDRPDDLHLSWCAMKLDQDQPIGRHCALLEARLVHCVVEWVRHSRPVMDPPVYGLLAKLRQL